MKNLFQVINEEIHDFYSDWQTEPSVADKYYDKKFGTSVPPTTQTAVINAELVGYVDKQAYQPLNPAVPVYKNPNSLEGFSENTRGILLNSGDIYLAQNYKAMHDNILDLLATKNIIPLASKFNYGENYPKNFIAVVRIANSKTFGPSEMYEYFPNYYLEIFDIAEQKLPYYFEPLKQ